MRNILIGVTGGIAAYKTANIISLLKKKGHNVKVIMTESATKIITPQTLEVLSRNRVVTDMWERAYTVDVEHISLSEWADVVLIVPATYNIVGKISNGIADDMLTTVISACKKPVYFSLAMNVNMYENPILKENIKKLKTFGYNFIEPDEGFLACNTNGKGRLKDEAEIVKIIEESFTENSENENLSILKKLKDKKIMITAGRTEEALDPVRYFSNNSSGKMGYSITEMAVKFGAKVTLVSGPTNLQIPNNVEKFIYVRSAVEMNDVALKEFDNQDIVIACAAVADYRPKNYSSEKIKKSDGNLVIEFERNPDILLNMSKKKEKQILVGFAAETENIIENAKEKLNRKNLDLIVANNASAMQKENNTIHILNKNSEVVNYENMPKSKIAEYILLEIVNGFY